MRIALNQLMTQVFVELNPILHAGEQDFYSFDTVRFWSEPYDKNVLFIAKASELPVTAPDVEPFLNLLCVEDIPIPESYLCHSVKLISFPKDCNTIEIYNKLSYHITDTLEGVSGLQSLTQAVVHGTFQDILEKVSHITRKSVALFSVHLSLVAYYERSSQIPPLWNAILEKNFYPGLDFMPKLSTGKIMILTKEKRILELEQNPGLAGEVFSPIIADNSSGEILGYIYFHETTPGAVIDNISSIQFICHSLSWRMWRYTHSPDKDKLALTELMRGILNGTFWEKTLIQEMLQKIKFTPQRNMAMIVITSLNKIRNDISQPLLKWPSMFYDMGINNHCFLYNNDMVVLVHTNSPVVLSEKMLSRLEERLQNHHCVAGISDIFYDFDGYIKNYYSRALAAAQMATLQTGKRQYMFYKDICMSHTVRYINMALSKNLIDPKLLKLVEHDRLHSTDYLMTLRYYWLYDKNAQKVCQVLHIHRNTLFYRLKKIRQLLHQDFQDHASYLSLNISIAILEHTGEIPGLPGMQAQLVDHDFWEDLEMEY